MIQVRCPGCQATFDMDERRIPKSGMRARCPKCTTSLQVLPDGTATPAAAGAAPAAGAGARERRLIELQWLDHLRVAAVQAVAPSLAGAPTRPATLACAASARFCHPEITLAAMPGAGGTQRLARVVGKHVAMDLLLTGRALSADEALVAGLVSRVVPDEALEAAAMSVARLVASYSSPVACRIKAAVNGAQVGLDAGLALERELFHACFSEHDFREGLAAFTEKRKPRFEHR